MARPKLPRQVDVAIAGAGSAGAAAAAFCAQAGLRVVCVDRQPLDRAGARWVNGVPAWCFRRAGLALPRGDEARPGRPVHVVAGYGPTRVVVDRHDVLEVDMRQLVARLHGAARDFGASLIGEVRVRGAEQGLLRTDRGDIAAHWIVDASGFRGARLLDPPAVDDHDVCVAAQQIRRIADVARARAFFAAHRTPYGHALCFTGVAGGFSVLQVRCDRDRMGILAGTIPAAGHPGGPALIEEFVAEQPWIGEVVFGGARAIPLRRPFDRIATANLAALGDAACQVFPAHGSGVGFGLIAARLLAEALAEYRGPLAYAVDWQREYGGMLAAYDLFRRLSQDLTPGELERLMGRLTTPDIARAAIDNQLPVIRPRNLPGLAIRAIRAPALALRFSQVAATMMLVRALYSRFPRDPKRLPAWSRRVARLFGDPPDEQRPQR